MPSKRAEKGTLLVMILKSAIRKQRMKYLSLKLPARILFVIKKMHKMSVLVAVVDIEKLMSTKVCWMSLTSEQYDLNLSCFFLAESSVNLICFKSNCWIQSKFIKDFDNEILEQANCIST